MAPSIPTSASQATTVILPLKLGAANKFEKNNFSLAYHNGISSIVGKGSVVLSATLDEMLKIKELGVDLGSNPRFLLNTQLKYDDLVAKQEKLERYRKSSNPIKYIVNYRAARVFYAAALSLYTRTLETSEQMQRAARKQEVQVVPSTEIQPIDDEVQPDATVGAIAISLPGPLDAESEQTIIDVAHAIARHASNPFVDNPNIPQLCDDDSIITLADTASLLTQEADTSNREETQPTSPSSPSYHFYIYNSLLTTSSNIHGVTLSQGSRNTGSSMVRQPP